MSPLAAPALGVAWALVVAVLAGAVHRPARRPLSPGATAARGTASAAGAAVTMAPSGTGSTAPGAADFPVHAHDAIDVGDYRGGVGLGHKGAGGDGTDAGHADAGCRGPGHARAAPLFRALGARVRGLARRPPDEAADRRTGAALAAAVALAAVSPALGALPLAWALLAPAAAARRAERSHEAAVVDQLPDVVDLLLLTTSAGLPVASALGAIGGRPGGPLGAGLAAGAAHVAGGGINADALALLGDAAGPAARPLLDALVEHDRYGTPLRPALERVGIEARVRRRRHAEESARRLPVTLLFPLVLTTLPAFVLLTVVPLLAGSLGSLSP